MDRIDIHIEVPAVAYKELSSATAGSSSAQMREQVEVARAQQRQRFARTSTRQNAKMTHRQIREHCKLDDAGAHLLHATMTELGLSARAHDKVLRVARTIADLDNSDTIKPMHSSEAVNYRMLDRQLWT